jgi:hypothetical protein
MLYSCIERHKFAVERRFPAFNGDWRRHQQGIPKPSRSNCWAFSPVFTNARPEKKGTYFESYSELFAWDVDLSLPSQKEPIPTGSNPITNKLKRQTASE